MSSLPPPLPDAAALASSLRARAQVLDGALAAWPALGKWSHAFFAAQHGREEVAVDHGAGGEPPRWRRAPLGDYLASLPAAAAAAAAAGVQPPYLRTWNLEGRVEAALAGDWAPLPWFADTFKRLDADRQPPFTWLFLGPPGCVTGLHVDIWRARASASAGRCPPAAAPPAVPPPPPPPLPP